MRLAPTVRKPELPASVLLKRTVRCGAGTARGHLWTRASAGYKVWRDVFVGPEASLYRTEDYREWRVGAHATGLQLGRFTFRLSTGWRRDESSPKGGPYGGLSVHVKM